MRTMPKKIDPTVKERCVCERSREVAFGDRVNSRWMVGVLLA